MNQNGKYGVDSPGQSLMAVSYEHGSKTSNFLIGEEFLDLLSNYIVF
jgi:hypothetical protein